jgi:hypothetical protein
MTRTRSAAAVAVSCLLLGGLAAPARAQVTTSDTDDQELRPPRPRFGAVFAQMSFSGVFDTNIDHDEDELESYGGVASARVGVRGGPTSVEYRLGFNRHTNSARWNRTTHRVVARFTERLASDWTLNAYGDVALQHTSEDREVGNYYTVQPRIDYQIDGRRRLRARLRYRFKRIEEQPASNATRSEAGIEFEQRFGGGQRASVEYRYQRNRAVEARQQYEGPVWDIEYRSDVGRRDDVRIGFELRQLTYPERFVSSATAEARRADDRWASTVSWTRALGSQVEWRIDYELERRLSNEPGRSFTAHRLGWTVSWAAGR